MSNIVQIPANKLVVKANKLIEARYKFTLWEMRVFTTMVSLIKPADLEFEYCKLYIKDLMKFYNSSSKEDYETIRQVPISLSKKQVELMYIGKEGKRRWANVTLFPAVTRPGDEERDEKNAYIELKFNEELKPLLLALKDKYRIYDIKNIVPLRSVYAIRIFELLKQYQNTKHKTREFELSYLKEILGLSETDDEFKARVNRLRGGAKAAAVKEGKHQKYPLYADFKRRVLLKAQQDLEKNCDICFTFKEIKEGRRVVSILFYIKNNKVEKLPSTAKYDTSVTSKEYNNSDLLNELHQKTKDWFTKNSLEKLLNTYPPEQVVKAINYTLNRIQKGDTIDNAAGHIIAMTKQENLVDPIEYGKEKKKQQKVKLANKVQKREIVQTEIKLLAKEWARKERVLMQELFSKQPEQKTAIFEKVKNSRFSKYKPESSLEENMANPMFAATFQNALRKEHPEIFEALSTQYKPQIDTLKKALNKL